MWLLKFIELFREGRPARYVVPALGAVAGAAGAVISVLNDLDTWVTSIAVAVLSSSFAILLQVLGRFVPAKAMFRRVFGLPGHERLPGRLGFTVVIPRLGVEGLHTAPERVGRWRRRAAPATGTRPEQRGPVFNPALRAKGIPHAITVDFLIAHNDSEAAVKLASGISRLTAGRFAGRVMTDERSPRYDQPSVLLGLYSNDWLRAYFRENESLDAPFKPFGQDFSLAAHRAEQLRSGEPVDGESDTDTAPRRQRQVRPLFARLRSRSLRAARGGRSDDAGGRLPTDHYSQAGIYVRCGEPEASTYRAYLPRDARHDRIEHFLREDVTPHIDYGLFARVVTNPAGPYKHSLVCAGIGATGTSGVAAYLSVESNLRRLVRAFEPHEEFVIVFRVVSGSERQAKIVHCWPENDALSDLIWEEPEKEDYLPVSGAYITSRYGIRPRHFKAPDRA